MKRHARPRVSKPLRAVAEPKKGPEAFDPPKYLASLTASINDGAKSAQTGALFFAFIGLYLLAVAFSTTDEDLLRERTIAISQLGMAVPVVFSFAVAPLIFVFLHIHTLIRYDMLSANLRQFDRELAGIVDEEDRERCRHLLTNVEFLRGLAVRSGSPLTSRLFHFTGWFMLAGFPLFVLTVIQLSALRYQGAGIVWTQRGAIVADAAAILWFVRRKWKLWDNAVILDFRQLLSRSFRRDLGLAILLGLLAFNFAWMGVPGPDATTVGHKATETLRQELT